MSASAYRRTCEQLGLCQGRPNCSSCTHPQRHEPLTLHPHRQHFTPTPAQNHQARRAVRYALLLGAATVVAVLAGWLP
ncbi:MAG: hypothetical protein ACK40L_08550 [Hydrogenophaga sp.]